MKNHWCCSLCELILTSTIWYLWQGKMLNETSQTQSSLHTEWFTYRSYLLIKFLTNLLSSSSKSPRLACCKYVFFLSPLYMVWRWSPHCVLTDLFSHYISLVSLPLFIRVASTPIPLTLNSNPKILMKFLKVLLPIVTLEVKIAKSTV